MKSQEEWKQLFRKLGAQAPDEWAAVEFTEGPGNLVALAFLRELAQLAPSERDNFWLSRWSSYEADTQPEACAAYKRLSAAGSSEQDLLALVRGVMSSFIYQVASALDAGEPADLDDSVAQHMQWRFCGVGERNELKVISGLSELVDAGESDRR